MDLLRQHVRGSEVTGYRFKAIRPTFDQNPFQLNGQRAGRTLKLWAQDHEDALTIDAEAKLRPKA